MRRLALPLFALLFAAAPSAEASVIYEFHSDRSLGGLTLVIDFVHTASGFISADTVVQAADLTSCSVAGTRYPGATCNLAEFDVNPSVGTFFVNVQLNIPSSPSGTAQHGFSEGSLSVASDSDGYNTNVAGGSARLRVTEVADPPVPEPTTLLLLATAAAGAFARRRLRR
jgi:hypothetical protein